MNEVKHIAQKYIEQKQETKISRLTKQEIEDNYVDWIAYYRANLGEFNRDYLGINIAPFQEIILDVTDDYDDTDIIASRGLSKSFITALRAIDEALLYPSSEIIVTSLTLAQANLLIAEKIKNTFCAEGGMFSSPVLCQLRKDKWITFKTDDQTGGLVVNFGNNSWIKAVVCGEGGRGQRSTYVIVDEFMLVKKKDYDEIIEPTKHPRMFKNRPIDLPEQPKTTKLSSARTKSNWGWTDLKNCVVQHYKGQSQGFYIGDIFTAVASGILTPQQYYQRKRNLDELSFLQEMCNIFLGSSEDSIFKYEDFEANQKVEQAFYPRTRQQVLNQERNSYCYKDNEIRYVVCDIAIATGESNDLTCVICGNINLNNGKVTQEYITTYSGLNSVEQAKRMKRIFYEYKATYFVFDSKGLGNALFDILTQETYDDEYGMTYPAWTVNTDKDLQISSDIVVNDKIARTMSNNAVNVIVPFAGTAEINSMMHIITRKALRDGTVSLLIDDYEKRGKLEEADPEFILKSSEDKADILIPFVETRYMINEAVSLEVKLTETGLIKVQEAKRTDTKDRYMTFGMFCMFGDKLYNKYCQQNNEDDNFDWDEVSLVF